MKISLTVEDYKKLQNSLPEGFFLMQNEKYDQIGKPKKPVPPRKKEYPKIEQDFEVVSHQKQTRLVQKKKVAPPPVVIQQKFTDMILKKQQGINLYFYIGAVHYINRIRQHQDIKILQNYEMKNFDLSFPKIVSQVHRQGDQLYPIELVVSDISKIFLSLYGEIPARSDQYFKTADLQKFIIEIYRKCVKERDRLINEENAKNQVFQQPVPKKQKTTYQTPYQQPKPKISEEEIKKTEQKYTIPLTQAQKRLLGRTIKRLSSQYLQRVCLIIFENLQNSEYAIDLDTLHLKKLRELQQYVHSIDDRNGEAQMIQEEMSTQQSDFIIEHQ